MRRDLTTVRPALADIEPGIGRAVELLRLRAGLSRDEFAGRAQPPLSRSAILKIENGERVPTAETLKRLAGALEVTVDELLIASWVAAEQSVEKRAVRAGLAASLLNDPSPAVRAGALAGLAVIAVLGAPVALGAAAAVAAGGLVHDHDRKVTEARDTEQLLQEVKRRLDGVTDPELLHRLLAALPKPAPDDEAIS